MTRLSVDESFVPFSVADGDELFPNGTFVFNVTRILAHLTRHPNHAELVPVAVDSFPRWSDCLDDAHVEAADLTRPIVLAEIAPGSYNVIDGHHRLEKARRQGVDTLPAFRLGATQHVPFLTSVKAYRAFVAYWNGKVEERMEATHG